MTPPGGDLDGDAVAREVAARSFVLVRNEAVTLPLDAAGADPGRGDRRAGEGRPGARRRQRGRSSPADIDLAAGRPRPGAVRRRRGSTRSAPIPRRSSCRAGTRPAGRALAATVGESAYEAAGRSGRPLDRRAARPASTRSGRGRWRSPARSRRRDGPSTRFAVSGFGTPARRSAARCSFEGSLHPADAGRAELGAPDPAGTRGRRSSWRRGRTGRGGAAARRWPARHGAYGRPRRSATAARGRTPTADRGGGAAAAKSRRGGGRGRHDRAGRVRGLRPHVAGPARPAGRAGTPASRRPTRVRSWWSTPVRRWRCPGPTTWRRCCSRGSRARTPARRWPTSCSAPPNPAAGCRRRGRRAPRTARC